MASAMTTEEIKSHQRIRSIAIDIEGWEEEKSLRLLDLAYDLILTHNITDADLDIIEERGNNETADEKELIKSIRDLLRGEYELEGYDG